MSDETLTQDELDAVARAAAAEVDGTGGFGVDMTKWLIETCRSSGVPFHVDPARAEKVVYILRRGLEDD